MIHLELTEDEYDNILDAIEYAIESREEAAQWTFDEEDKECHEDAAAECKELLDKLIARKLEYKKENKE